MSAPFQCVCKLHPGLQAPRLLSREITSKWKLSPTQGWPSTGWNQFLSQAALPLYLCVQKAWSPNSRWESRQGAHLGPSGPFNSTAGAPPLDLVFILGPLRRSEKCLRHCPILPFLGAFGTLGGSC